jgi:nitrous oxidase accessory protein NosD
MIIAHHHPHRRTVGFGAVAVAVAVAVIAALTSTTTAAASNHTIVVHAGESIQAALDHAGPGDKVVVGPGVYTEQLVLTTDRVSLVGNGAVLRPPPTLASNICSGLAGPDNAGADTQAGICVAGTGVELAPFNNNEHRRFISVDQRVRGVTISGFRVESFSGPNVAFVAAADARLNDSVLVDGDRYGALTVGSTHSRFSRNVVTTGGEPDGIGLCIDDVAPATVDHNNVSGYIAGFCVQTQRADVRSNVAHDNCIGVYVDPGIGAVVRDNHIVSNNAPCADLYSYISGVGVYLQGSHGTVVSGNRIEGHRPAGYRDVAALVITDEAAPAPASDNTVRNNRFADNMLDVLVDSAGAGNVVRHNRCTTSQPAGLCD